jgi:predicted neutral ceramidase superfamily lipid hydrolase
LDAAVIVLAALLHLVVLHGPGGHEINVNPSAVTTVQAARDDRDASKQTTAGVACIINLTDGKFVAVRENCDDVRTILQGD